MSQCASQVRYSLLDLLLQQVQDRPSIWNSRRPAEDHYNCVAIKKWQPKLAIIHYS